MGLCEKGFCLRGFFILKNKIINLEKYNLNKDQILIQKLDLNKNNLQTLDSYDSLKSKFAYNLFMEFSSRLF